MTTQLELNLGVVQPPIKSVVDPYWDEPTIKVGDRVRDTCPIRPVDKEGVIREVHSTWCIVLWDGWGHPSNSPIEYLEIAHQHISTCESVGGQVENDTKKVAHQHDVWIEKYSVVRSGVKYFYWRFAWREAGRKHRHYIGSCTNPKARERVERVKSAISLGKSPSEIVGLLQVAKTTTDTPLTHTR